MLTRIFSTALGFVLALASFLCVMEFANAADPSSTAAIVIHGSEYKAVQVALGDYLARQKNGLNQAGDDMSDIQSYDIEIDDKGDVYTVTITLNDKLSAKYLGGGGEYRLTKGSYQILEKHLYR